MSPVLRLGKCQLIFCLEPPKLIKVGLKHEGVHAQNSAAAQSDTASIGLEHCHQCRKHLPTSCYARNLWSNSAATYDVAAMIQQSYGAPLRKGRVSDQDVDGAAH